MVPVVHAGTVGACDPQKKSRTENREKKVASGNSIYRPQQTTPNKLVWYHSSNKQHIYTIYLNELTQQ